MLNKKNDLFDESIQQKLDEIKESPPQEEKKPVLKKLPGIIIAVVFAVSIILRFFF